MQKKYRFLALSASILLTGCAGHGIEGRYDTATGLAQSANMQRVNIQAAPFEITTYQRIRDPEAPTHVYIEGDGLAWVGRGTPSLDPTPVNPIALELAIRDRADNVVYVARPCQYSKMTAPEPCPMKYWTGHRFAPEVVGAVNATLEEIKQTHDLQNYELTGFSGGAAVAVLVAARRDDVTALRTVAGNLDHGLVMRMHEVTPLYGSLDAVDAAQVVAHIPQHHFIGAEDRVITAAIAESFQEAAGESSCTRTSVVPNTTHEKGWSNQWPALLNYPLGCSK